MDEYKRVDISYDQMIKKMLGDDPELTIKFINGLMGENISLDAPVVWLDKESSDGRKPMLTDSYPRIGEQLFCVEIENRYSKKMLLRAFDYTNAGAMRHNRTASENKMTLDIPKSCVIFLKSTKNTPKNYRFVFRFGRQEINIEVPVVSLSRLTPEEIAEKNLFPIGQFYPHSCEPLTNEKAVLEMRDNTELLLRKLKAAVDRDDISVHAADQMIKNMRICFHNALLNSDFKGDDDMFCNIEGTLPWYDLKTAYDKANNEARIKGMIEGVAEGVIKGMRDGKAEGKAELALDYVRRHKNRDSDEEIRAELTEWGLPSEEIDRALAVQL